ncbi:MAG TPA: hypothetical protein VMR28_02635 [Candidatus Saccharimonadales bacterium]|nr:hypothetical protein [Candidatus Saccharimonadales bacterium]
MNNPFHGVPDKLTGLSAQVLVVLAVPLVSETETFHSPRLGKLLSGILKTGQE